MDRRDQINVLNDLLHKSYDAEKGFREAAEDVESPHLKELFRKYSSQRSSFGNELKSMITSLGGEIDTGDTIAAKMHRAWMDLKSALASNEEKNILEEVKRGESNALAHYEEALEELDSSSIAYETVAKQRNQVRESIATAASLIPTYDRDRDHSNSFGDRTTTDHSSTFADRNTDRGSNLTDNNDPTDRRVF